MKRDLVFVVVLIVALAGAGVMALGDMGKIFRARPADGHFPQLDLATLDGPNATFDGRSDGVSVVTVFATWCVPCKGEMPNIATASNAPWASRAHFVEIDESESAGKVRAFLADYPALHATVLLGDSWAVNAIGAFAIPETFVVSPNGVIEARHGGRATLKDLRMLVTAAEKRFDGAKT